MLANILFGLMLVFAPDPPSPPPLLDPALIAFFSGSWRCAGAFANGKPIASTMTFTPDLDRHWLIYRDTDAPPNSYKASAAWGIDTASGKLVSMQADNFGYGRLFVSAGWQSDTLVFERSPILNQPANAERFTFHKESAESFRMTYERANATGEWRLGDSLLCLKQK